MLDPTRLETNDRLSQSIDEREELPALQRDNKSGSQPTKHFHTRSSYTSATVVTEEVPEKLLAKAKKPRRKAH